MVAEAVLTVADVEIYKLGKNGVVEMRIPQVPTIIWDRRGRVRSAREVMAEIERDHVDLMLQTIRGYVAEETPRDTGLGAQGWQSEIMGTLQTGIYGGRVTNAMPQIVVLDRGRRPGKGVSRAGQAAIARWVRRKFGLSGKAAQSATYAIVWNIRRRGLKPRNIVAKGMSKAAPNLRAIMGTLTAAYGQGLSGGKLPKPSRPAGTPGGGRA